MNIQLVAGKYKSISSLSWYDIPAFAVVTGPNGSGKTQLLELIAHAAGLTPPPIGPYVSRLHIPDPFDAKVSCSVSLNAQNTMFLRSYWGLSDPASSIAQVRASAEEAWNARQYQSESQGSSNWETLWSVLEGALGRPRSQFDRESFDALLPPNFILLNKEAILPNTMYSSLPLLFMSYALRLHHAERDGLCVREFFEKHGDAPWDSVNRVLKLAGLKYEALPPVVPKATWTQEFNGSYNLELRNLLSGTTIKPNALSSGERVIFLTAIWSYFFSQTALASREALLLLDEPDAHLHPALTSVFLRVIREELVERRGIRVIATTHSPSTVALVEEGELFVMDTEEPRVRPVASKWDAVARLTTGIVTVGSHTKAVFVEDKTDAAFFRTVQTILARNEAPAIKFDVGRCMNFIAASDGKAGGGKNSVISAVEKIETTQVAGIVDRDNEADPPRRVYAGRRRHLESYLLDPLFIYALLLDENCETRPNFAPNLDHRHSRSLMSCDRDVLQNIADGMIALYGELGGHAADHLVQESYVGGAVIELPQWFFQCDMKKLMEPIRLRLGVRWDPGYLIQKYEVVGIVPFDLAQMLINVQNA